MLRLLLLVSLSAIARAQLDELFLCGFRPSVDCSFDPDTRCQFVVVGDCQEFNSPAFEEFGLSEVFAQVSRTGETYGYQIFKNPDCTGNPFGFEVKQDGLIISVCAPLSLPFVGNQVDFAFHESCEVCDKDQTIGIPGRTFPTVANTVAPTIPQAPEEEEGLIRIDEPRINGFLIRTAANFTHQSLASPSTAELACLQLGHDFNSSHTQYRSIKVTGTELLHWFEKSGALELRLVLEPVISYISVLFCQDAPSKAGPIDSPRSFARGKEVFHDFAGESFNTPRNIEYSVSTVGDQPNFRIATHFYESCCLSNRFKALPIARETSGVLVVDPASELELPLPVVWTVGQVAPRLEFFEGHVLNAGKQNSVTLLSANETSLIFEAFPVPNPLESTLPVVDEVTLFLYLPFDESSSSTIELSVSILGQDSFNLEASLSTASGLYRVYRSEDFKLQLLAAVSNPATWKAHNDLILDISLPSGMFSVFSGASGQPLGAPSLLLAYTDAALPPETAWLCAYSDADRCVNRQAGICQKTMIDVCFLAPEAFATMLSVDSTSGDFVYLKLEISETGQTFVEYFKDPACTGALVANIRQPHPSTDQCVGDSSSVGSTHFRMEPRCPSTSKVCLQPEPQIVFVEAENTLHDELGITISTDETISQPRGADSAWQLIEATQAVNGVALQSRTQNSGQDVFESRLVYTVPFLRAGIYNLRVRAACDGSSSTIRVPRQPDISGPPDTIAKFDCGSTLEEFRWSSVIATYTVSESAVFVFPVERHVPDMLIIDRFAFIPQDIEASLETLDSQRPPVCHERRSRDACGIDSSCTFNEQDGLCFPASLPLCTSLKTAETCSQLSLCIWDSAKHACMNLLSDPCQCSTDGLSGPAATVRPGCSTGGPEAMGGPWCYVTGGAAAQCPCSTSSSLFDGAAFRSCSIQESLVATADGTNSATGSYALAKEVTVETEDQQCLVVGVFLQAGVDAMHKLLHNPQTGLWVLTEMSFSDLPMLNSVGSLLATPFVNGLALGQALPDLQFHSTAPSDLFGSVGLQKSCPSAAITSVKLAGSSAVLLAWTARCDLACQESDIFTLHLESTNHNFTTTLTSNFQTVAGLQLATTYQLYILSAGVDCASLATMPVPFMFAMPTLEPATDLRLEPDVHRLTASWTPPSFATHYRVDLMTVDKIVQSQDVSQPANMGSVQSVAFFELDPTLAYSASVTSLVHGAEGPSITSASMHPVFAAPAGTVTDIVVDAREVTATVKFNVSEIQSVVQGYRVIFLEDEDRIDLIVPPSEASENLCIGTTAQCDIGVLQPESVYLVWVQPFVQRDGCTADSCRSFGQLSLPAVFRTRQLWILPPTITNIDSREEEVTLFLQSSNGTVFVPARVRAIKNSNGAEIPNQVLLRYDIGLFEEKVVLDALEPGTEYLVEVGAAASRGSEPPTSRPMAFRTTETKPDAPPVDVVTEVVDSTTVRLSWEPPTPSNGQLTQYTVYINEVLADTSTGDEQRLSLIAQNALDRASVLIEGLEPGSAYLFRVTGSTSKGESPISDSVQVSPSMASRSLDSSSGVSLGILIAIVSVAALLTLLALFTFFFWKRQKESANQAQDIAASQVILESARALFQERFAYVIDLMGTNTDFELNGLELIRDRLTIAKSLGVGTFTNTNLASLEPEHFNEDSSRVAVKSALPDAPTDGAVALITASRLLSVVSHNNIIRLLGVCTGEAPLLAVYEHMPKGQLASYLRNQRTQMNEWSINEASLLFMTAQLASALRYLASRRIVHRELAARHVLVGEANLVKLSHFEDAVSVPLFEVHRAESIKEESIKWVAVETANTRIFTLASDVWSFGVLVWEIMTLGRSPFADLDNAEVVQAIMSGARLEQPMRCNDTTYELLQKCWGMDPDDRPQAEELVVIIDRELRKAKQSTKGPAAEVEYEYQDELNLALDLTSAAANVESMEAQGSRITSPAYEEEDVSDSEDEAPEAKPALSSVDLNALYGVGSTTT